MLLNLQQTLLVVVSPVVNIFQRNGSMIKVKASRKSDAFGHFICCACLLWAATYLFFCLTCLLFVYLSYPKEDIYCSIGTFLCNIHLPSHITHWGRVMHICVRKIIILDGTKPLSDYQCWNIINWTLWNKLQWNIYRNSDIFIEENAFENVVW